MLSQNFVAWAHSIFTRNAFVRQTTQFPLRLFVCCLCVSARERQQQANAFRRHNSNAWPINNIFRSRETQKNGLFSFVDVLPSSAVSIDHYTERYEYFATIETLNFYFLCLAPFFFCLLVVCCSVISLYGLPFIFFPFSFNSMKMNRKAKKHRRYSEKRKKKASSVAIN